MAERLKDLRTSIQTIEQADAAFATLAKAEIEMARIDAECEAEIAKHKAFGEVAKEHHAEQAEAARADLAAFIESHPAEFSKPRKRKTDWGTYGLHTATKVRVFDKDAAIAHCIAEGLNDCLRRTITVLTKPVGELIKDGTEIDGCELSSGDTAICTVKRELIQEAKESI